MIELTYTPTLADFQAFNLHIVGRPLRKMTVFGIVTLLLGLLSVFVLRRSSYAHDLQPSFVSILAFPIALLALACVLVALTRLGVKSRWNKTLALQEQKRYVFDELGIRVEAKSFGGFSDWSNFSQVEFTPRFVYLMTPQRHYHYFPLAAASNPEALAALLCSKVKVK